MPWRCPMCGMQIRHSDADDRPHSGDLYRCHVCRLELVLDVTSDRLVVTAQQREEATEKIRNTR